MLIRSQSYVVTDENEDMGLRSEAFLNPIVIVAEHVVAYWPHENGIETIVDTKADIYHIAMPFEEFDRIFDSWEGKLIRNN